MLSGRGGGAGGGWDRKGPAGSGNPGDASTTANASERGAQRAAGLEPAGGFHVHLRFPPLTSSSSSTLPPCPTPFFSQPLYFLFHPRLHLRVHLLAITSHPLTTPTTIPIVYAPITALVPRLSSRLPLYALTLVCKTHRTKSEKPSRKPPTFSPHRNRGARPGWCEKGERRGWGG